MATDVAEVEPHVALEAMNDAQGDGGGGLTDTVAAETAAVVAAGKMTPQDRKAWLKERIVHNTRCLLKMATVFIIIASSASLLVGYMEKDATRRKRYIIFGSVTLITTLIVSGLFLPEVTSSLASSLVTGFGAGVALLAFRKIAEKQGGVSL